MKIGTQIAYVPDHAEGDVHHKDVQYGFVTKDRGDGNHFCRYWYKPETLELRTTSCSELTPDRCLVPFVSVPEQAAIEILLLALGYELEEPK